MKYIDEFRRVEAARQIVAEIAQYSHIAVRLMEFCGGHTHAIARLGLRQLLPSTVQLSAGPGCPVCVTPAGDIERAIALAGMPGVILVTFGDMIRVPGAHGSLQEARAAGADVRVAYSPLDALTIACQNPTARVVFLGVGFETTAPSVAATVLQAEADQVSNFYVLSLHKLTPPAMRAILEAGPGRLDGIIGPGHVSTIIGAEAWQFLPQQYGISCVVAGFEPLDILRAIAISVKIKATGQPAVYNAYRRNVRATGNPQAIAMMRQVFRPDQAEWRGLGIIADSGLFFRPEYAHRDAAQVFDLDAVAVSEPDDRPSGCRCGDVLRGLIEPSDCPLFGRVCTPHTPRGPCMVSGEGACAAGYQYETDR